MKVFFTRALTRLRRLPVVMPPRASRGVDRNEPRVAEPELEVHRPVNLLPERPAGRIVQVVVPDDTDVRDPERFHQAQIGLVPLERAGACEVSEIRKEERLTLAHLSYELREDCLRGRVDPRTRVARKGKPQRLVEGRLLDPFRHLRVAQRRTSATRRGLSHVRCAHMPRSVLLDQRGDGVVSRETGRARPQREWPPKRSPIELRRTKARSGRRMRASKTRRTASRATSSCCRSSANARGRIALRSSG